MPNRCPTPTARYPLGKLRRSSRLLGEKITNDDDDGALVVVLSEDTISGAGAGAGSLDFLRNRPKFQALRTMVQSNPHILQPILQELGKKNRSLLRMIEEHYSEFIQLINEPMDGTEGSANNNTSPPDVDKMDEDPKQEVQAQAVEAEPKAKDKDIPSVQDEEVEQTEKRHLNVVFIGHVVCSYLQGKTVEVGRAHFEAETTRFTILDAPGHKSYVPNMISGASQADIGVLVISARKGEFETGYERGGQTREHVQLAKTLGVTKLLVVVNKMDDPTVNWSKERYDEIESKMIPFLKQSGYHVKKDVLFLPISGLMGSNLKTRMDRSICSWWDGPCLFEALDSIEVPMGDPKRPFRMPIIDKFKDMGTVVMGKVESGTIREGDSIFIMPNKDQVKVVAIYIDENRVKRAGPGENLRVRLSGVEEEDILAGFVLSSVANPISAVTEFVAQLAILELLDNAIFTAGYKAVLHIHSVVEECEIVELLQQIDPKTKKPMKKKVLFVKNGAVVLCRVQVSNMICVEKFSDFPQLGRFTLRTEGKTIAVGKVTAL